MPPAAWTWATARRASVVLPLLEPPRIAVAEARGRPPNPRIESSARKPVGMASSLGRAPRSTAPFAGRGATASDPTTSEPQRGAAFPQRSRRDERAAWTPGGGVVMGFAIIERMFYQSTPDRTLDN